MRYLTAEQVLYIHHVVAEGSGVRDEGAIRSAVARPRGTFDGKDLYGTVCAKAAALFQSLLKNHPFVDGNKRTAITAAGLFLEHNGRRLTATNEELEAFTRAAAGGSHDLEELADRIRGLSVEDERSGSKGS